MSARWPAHQRVLCHAARGCAPGSGSQGSGRRLPPASGGGVSRMATTATFRRSIPHRFFLEYDRGTESRRQYAAKFRAYYRYRDSGQAQRDYDGFPTLLRITTDSIAESRIAEEAYGAWAVRNCDALP